MKLIAFFIFVIFVALGAVALKSLQDAPIQNDAGAKNFSKEVAILGDGTPIFAPNGTIGRTLADWLADPNSTERYFEVGGPQFRSGEVEPVPDAKARLTRLAVMLQGYPDARVGIVGFARPTVNAIADAQLSKARCQKVLDLLVADGVSRSRLFIFGHAPVSNAPSQGVAPDRIAIVLSYPDRLKEPGSAGGPNKSYKRLTSAQAAASEARPALSERWTIFG